MVSMFRIWIIANFELQNLVFLLLEESQFPLDVGLVLPDEDVLRSSFPSDVHIVPVVCDR